MSRPYWIPCFRTALVSSSLAAAAASNPVPEGNTRFLVKYKYQLKLGIEEKGHALCLRFHRAERTFMFDVCLRFKVLFSSFWSSSSMVSCSTEAANKQG